MRSLLLLIALTTACCCCCLATVSSARIFAKINSGNVHYLEKLIGEETNINKTNFCQGCRSMVSFGTRFNSTEHQDEYKSLFENFCELYYPASTDFRQGPCSLAIEGLFFMSKQIDPVYYCDKIGACGELDEDNENEENLLSTLQDEPPRVRNIICDACVKGFEQFKKQLQDPSFIDQLHNTVESLCDYMKAIDMDKECRHEFNKYIDQAIDFVKHLDSRKYCQSVQLCPTTNKQNQDQNQLAATLASFHGFGLETSVELNGQVMRDIDQINLPNVYRKYNNDMEEKCLTNHKNGPACMICQVIVREVGKLIKNNNTEEYIEDSLLKVCSLVYKKGNPNLEQCDDMVKAYTKELIELLADESNPEVVCMLIEQCVYEKQKTTTTTTTLKQEDKQQEHTLSAQSITTLSNTNIKGPSDSDLQTTTFGEFIASMNPEIPVDSVRTCVECKLFVKYLQDTFQDQKSRDSFREYLLENLCNSLKEQELKDSCTKMVNQYSDYFFKAIADQLDPGVVCSDLKACKKRHAIQSSLPLYVQSIPPTTFQVSKYLDELITGFVPPAKESLKTYRSAFCDQCVDIITKLDEYLATHSVDDDVKVLIEQVCNKLPDQQSQDTCRMVVKTFGQKIVEILHTMDNPKQVCQTISLC